MLEKKDLGRLFQIVEHCNRIKEKIKAINKEEFDLNLDVREIVSFNIFQIGELAKGLSTDFTKENNEIPWRQIKGMRDRIGHGYDTINYDIVWSIAKNDIPTLSEFCEKIIEHNI